MLVGVLLLALWAWLGCCPHLTVTLLARMLQGALLAQMREKFQVLDPLEHSGPDHADPAGQHAIFQTITR